MAAFPTSRIPAVRPLAAADYFLRNRLLAWFTTRIVGIVPIDRGGGHDGDPLAPASKALLAGDLLLLFPEGTRGEPGVFGELKSGVARLALRHPDVPVIPVWLDGCERTMPRGAYLPHPVACRASVGRPLFPRPAEHPAEFLSRIRTAMLALHHSPGVAA
jgi:1-acyl-sn-glycerol-3-phosphate acyltransferase